MFRQLQRGNSQIMNMPFAQPKKEANLIRMTAADQCTDGQHDTLENIYAQYAKPIFRYCHKRLYLRELAEDTTSSVFLALAENIDQLVKDNTHFGKWLFAVARNLSANHLRKSGRRLEILNKVAQDNATFYLNNSTAVSYDQMDWPVLYKAMMSLKPIRQDIILLRFFEKMEHNEIAHILDIKPSAVRVHQLRALNQLQTILAKAFG